MREIPSHKYKWMLFSGLLAMQFSTFGFADQKITTPQEALVLRRITEFWKDGDFSTAKKQIIEFLSKHPETNLRDHLNAMLGDLYFQEGDYRQALATFALVQNPEIQSKTLFNQLQALFEIKDYESVVKKANAYLKDHKGESKQDLNIKMRYLLAESLFRQAMQASDEEQKTHFLKMAKPQYKILTQTKYGDRVLFPLAEIHRLLKEDQNAAALYAVLAQKFPAHQEKFLFQAALLQIKDDPKEALKNFEGVYALHGKREHLAAFNKLVLLSQLQEHNAFISFFDQVIDQMPKDKALLLQYYQGKSLYTVENYERAAIHLEKYTTGNTPRSKDYKAALFMLINCSSHLKDCALLERCIYTFKTNFPQDENLPKVILLHAQLVREKGDYVQSLRDLTTVLTDYPNFPQREAALYDYALLLSQTKKWSQSREAFTTLIEKYPESSRLIPSWRHLINCYVEEFKDPTSADATATRDTFANVLETALKSPSIFNENEKQQYTFVLVKCLFELGKYDRALPILTQYIADTTDTTSLGEAHLLLALCQQKAKSDDALFVFHGEKALALNPDLPEKNILHLELYNAYLTLSLAQPSQEEKQTFLEKAAAHLYQSKAWQEKTLKRDNHLWLANYYYKRAKNSDPIDVVAGERAEQLFKNLFGITDQSTALNISSENLFLENEVLKYADLLGVQNANQDQIALLETLVQKQQNHPEISWKMQRRAILQLAMAYEKDKQIENAKKSYQYLVKTGEESSSTVTSFAQLNLSRLEFQLLKEDEKSMENPKMMVILNALKDLQIQKKLYSEPAHIEAALEYAEIRTLLSDTSSKIKNHLFFLNRIKEDFLSNKDPISIEYNQMRAQLPEKDKIFQSYMRYIDSEILKLQAEIAKAENHFQKAETTLGQAQAVLDSLLNQPESLKPYLFDRVKRSRVEIAQNL